MLVEVGNEWILNQSNEFIVFKILKSLKTQNKEQIVFVLCPIHQNFKTLRTRWTFNMLQNSIKRHVGWYGNDSLLLLLWG
jgi:hypothetical protein